MSTSSDDGQTLEHRQTMLDAAKQDNSESPPSSMPSWMAEHQSPFAGQVLLIDSDESDSDGRASDKHEDKHTVKEHGGTATEAQKEGGSKPAAAAAANAAAAVKQEQCNGSAPTQRASQTVPHAAAVPLCFPDKLTQKVLLELKPSNDSTTDLSGDAGAVGRMLVRGSKGKEEVLVDLKGVLYDATIVPLAVSACVVNITAADAKVECVMNDMLHLRPLSDQNIATVVEGNIDDDSLNADTYAAEGATADTREQKPKGKKGKADDKAPASKASSAKKAKTGTAGKASKTKAGAASSSGVKRKAPASASKSRTSKAGAKRAKHK